MNVIVSEYYQGREMFFDGQIYPAKELAKIFAKKLSEVNQDFALALSEHRERQIKGSETKRSAEALEEASKKFEKILEEIAGLGLEIASDG